jgi:hypothetical protein
MILRNPRRFLSFCLISLQCGCPDDELTKLNPKIEVEPTAIDFGAGIVDQNNVRALAIRNKGSGVLEIGSIEVSPPGEIFSFGANPRSIQPFQEKTLDVVFVPKVAHEAYAAELVIQSNDPATPEVRVPLNGTGGVREIEVNPTEIDFGVVNEGTEPRRTLEIRNIGGDPLIVSSVTWTSTSVDMDLVPGTFTSGSILPGTSTVVELVYSPVDLGGDQGVITVFSNDEDEPEVEVPAMGFANLAPRAIAWGCDKSGLQIGCDGRETSREISAGFRRLVGLDGRESYDPEGSAITSYAWRMVERPDGSNAVIYHSTDDITMRDRATGDVEIDRVGRFDVRLVVKDDRGVESLDRPESHVRVLPKDLEILLRWDINTDVDLHFVRPGGTVGDYGSGDVGTSTGSDCSTYNREPNWNDVGTSLDDPRLDKDDVTGSGPEIISVDSPEGNGPHAVYAHYCDSQNLRVNANVTIEVHVKGELIATIPEELPGFRLDPGEVWRGAEVTWDPETETAVVLGFENDAPELRPELCLIR